MSVAGLLEGRDKIYFLISESKDSRSSRSLSFSGGRGKLKVFLGYVNLEAHHVLALRDKRTSCYCGEAASPFTHWHTNPTSEVVWYPLVKGA